MRATGYIRSAPSDKDTIFGSKPIAIPESYELKDLCGVVDQGNIGCCVSCVCKEMLSHLNRFNKGAGISFDYLYRRRKDKSIDGMSPREAFEILKADGRIKTYAKVSSELFVKPAIIANGPVLIALPVRSTSDNFWEGNQNLGGHAVAVVGYDKNSLTIKNSWGMSYGINGFAKFPMSKFGLIMEAWTILN